MTEHEHEHHHHHDEECGCGHEHEHHHHHDEDCGCGHDHDIIMDIMRRNAAGRYIHKCAPPGRCEGSVRKASYFRQLRQYKG